MSGPDCEVCGEYFMDCPCVEQRLMAFKLTTHPEDFDCSPRWIKCSDRMPEDGQRCWVYNKFNQAVEFEVWKWAQWCDHCSLDDISHWMPYYTPEPPRDE